MSGERREKIELSVSWGSGAGSIRCEADDTPNAMKTTVQKLLAAFVSAWPPVRDVLPISEQRQPEAVAGPPVESSDCVLTERLWEEYKRGHGDGQSGLRRSVADDLLKALGIEKTIHDPVLDLDLGMIKVAEAVADANKWREREKTATDIRDAALDEAERIATTMASNNTVAANGASTSDLAVTYRTRAAAFQEMALECRALKSKPALQPAKNPGELQQAATKWEPDSPTDLPDEEQPPSEPPPEKLRELFEHREAREEATRSVDALATSDVHDFGWALAQMRAGNKVRRREWAAQNYEGCWWLVKAEDGTSWWRGSTSFGQEPRHLLATDWEVVE